ncbi:hypothetical protein Tco_0704267 [Tanacetum coccineum]|uniref:Retrovirus-related Pol polyprotein from transposon TNT 1-94 n=1 Tax=Tanacetum coccineum TaxID=301880 RepID=A0ABQ4Y1L9_9ASTR
MVPPNNLGPNLNEKSVNETQYRGMIGSLMYLTASRPDIQFSTCLCARYHANPKESHLIAVKRIFKYLKGTHSLGLWYPKCSGFDLKGYSNSDYAGCNMDRKSTSGACQLLGGKLVCWSAKKHQYVAMSSTEVEYVAAAGCCANVLRMKSQFTYYDIIYKKVPIFYDNTSAIAISNNPVLHSRTKHIDIRYHFIRDHILKGDIELHFIPTQYQLVDIFTKPLNELTFKRMIVELGHIVNKLNWGLQHIAGIDVSVLRVVFMISCIDDESGFLGSGRGCAEFEIEQVAVASTKIIGNVGRVSMGFIDSIPMQNTTTPICKPSKFADGTSKGTAYEDVTMTKNPVNQVDNTPDNVVSPSYHTKLRPTSFTMANLRKLKANVPNDTDYEIWLPLYLVDEKNKDHNKEEPSFTQIFKRTRQRKEGNVYANTNDDTENKIEKMRNYNPPEDESAPADPFLAVMNKEYDGHRRLFGRGVTNTLIKKVNGDGSASAVLREIVKSPTGCVSTGFTDYIPMQNTTTPICEPSKFADGTSKGTADQDMTMTNNPVNQNGSEQVDNTLVNMVPPSCATKLRPTSSIMANLQKLKASVPNDADYDVRFPLDSVHEVNKRMKNSL